MNSFEPLLKNLSYEDFKKYMDEAYAVIEARDLSGEVRATEVRFATFGDRLGMAIHHEQIREHPNKNHGETECRPYREPSQWAKDFKWPDITDVTPPKAKPVERNWILRTPVDSSLADESSPDHYMDNIYEAYMEAQGITNYGPMTEPGYVEDIY